MTNQYDQVKQEIRNMERAINEAGQKRNEALAHVLKATQTSLDDHTDDLKGLLDDEGDVQRALENASELHDGLFTKLKSFLETNLRLVQSANQGAAGENGVGDTLDTLQENNEAMLRAIQQGRR
jgi:phosphoglycerate-specific signal transduction histidine kinase